MNAAYKIYPYLLQDTPGQVEIKAVDSTYKIKAIDIFTMAIRYMKDELMDRLKMHGGRYCELCVWDFEVISVYLLLGKCAPKKISAILKLSMF